MVHNQRLSEDESDGGEMRWNGHKQIFPHPFSTRMAKTDASEVEGHSMVIVIRNRVVMEEGGVRVTRIGSVVH